MAIKASRSRPTSGAPRSREIGDKRDAADDQHHDRTDDDIEHLDHVDHLGHLDRDGERREQADLPAAGGVVKRRVAHHHVADDPTVELGDQ